MGRKSKCLYKCSVRGRGRRCEKKIHRSTSQKGSINLGGEGLRSLRRRERSGMGVTSFAIEDVQNHDEEACRSSEVKIGSLWTAKKSKTRGWCVLRDHCRTQTCPCYERPRLDLIKHPHWATLSTRGEKEANNIHRALPRNIPMGYTRYIRNIPRIFHEYARGGIFLEYSLVDPAREMTKPFLLARDALASTDATKFL